MLLVRYEQLKRNPEEELKRIASFAGLAAKDTQIADAVRSASFDTMRQIEETSGHPREKFFSGRFIRAGMAGGWENYFGEREKMAFKNTQNEALVRLGYEQDLQW